MDQSKGQKYGPMDGQDFLSSHSCHSRRQEKLKRQETYIQDDVLHHQLYSLPLGDSLTPLLSFSLSLLYSGTAHTNKMTTLFFLYTISIIKAMYLTQDESIENKQKCNTHKYASFSTIGMASGKKVSRKSLTTSSTIPLTQ